MMENIQAGKKLMLVHLPPLPPKPSPRGRVERLGNFGKPTGELGTVEQLNEDDVLVEWDNRGHMRLLTEL
jgi:hypothetical protein